MLPRLFLAFRSPVFGSDAHYVATVLAAILGTGKGSRFQRALVREREIASEASAFTVRSREGHRPAHRRRHRATRRQRGDARGGGGARDRSRATADGVTDDEVQRAVALLETALVSSLQSAGDRADKLSMFATYLRRSRARERADGVLSARHDGGW